MPEPIRLADLDPRRIAVDVLNLVHHRVLRDTARLGLVIHMANEGQDETEARAAVFVHAEVFRTALLLAQWATSGLGDAGAIPACLRQVRADLEGIDVMKTLMRGSADLSTLPGVALVAAEARLALGEGRTVSAVELATLASIDEHSVRAAVKAGTLRPVGPGRPMRFAADLARTYLYTRGVPGFAAPEAPTP
jgi:hypothetical protein